MLTNDRKQILLLNPVRIDYKLLKHKKYVENLAKSGINEVSVTDAGVLFQPLSETDVAVEAGWADGFNFGSRWDAQNIWDGVPFSVQRQFNSAFMRKVVELYIKFRLLFDSPTKNPVDIFAEVKSNFKLLENSDVEAGKVIEMLKTLERAKQVVAAREVKSRQFLIMCENRLIEAGLTQYQTEESLIAFIVQCKKGLCLTELENFTRVIPTEVIEKIEAAEQVKVFDNYYILHYDPSGAKNIHLTEKPKPKDPIVFGVIKGSTKLYYIADWIDEYCNLTYKDILAQGVDMKLELQKEN